MGVFRGELWVNYVSLYSKTLYPRGRRQFPILGLQPEHFRFRIFPPPQSLDPEIENEPLNLDWDVSFHERFDELERPGLKIEIDCMCLVWRVDHIELILPRKHSAAGLVHVATSPPPLHACFVHPIEHSIRPPEVHESVVIAFPVDMIAKPHAFAVIWSKGHQNHSVNEQHVVPGRFLFVEDK